MIIGIPKEIYPGERRVALTPAALPALLKNGFEVLIQTDAGLAAGFPDADYQGRGARIAATRAEVFQAGDIIAQVLAWGANDVNGRDDLSLLRRGQYLTGFLRPFGEKATLEAIAQSGAIALALELMPRITRAQSMDVLSSMATVSGYKAVLLAAQLLPRFFPMLTTAAGTITPARVLIIGVGVAGLQAIATARRLGAVVSAYDVRPAVKEQVQSLGARFVELPLETQGAEDKRGYAVAQAEAFYRKPRELLGKAESESHVVITTAVVPGRKAPILVTAEMVKAMAPGAVIVDLAAERGGNCELTQPRTTAEVQGVRIVGEVNLAATVPHDASQLYARNISTFLQHAFPKGQNQPDWNDEILRETLLTREGEIAQPRIREFLQLPPLPAGAASGAR